MRRTTRLKLFKVAGDIEVSVRRVHVRLASAYPYQQLFALVLARIRAKPG